MYSNTYIPTVSTAAAENTKPAQFALRVRLHGIYHCLLSAPQRSVSQAGVTFHNSSQMCLLMFLQLESNIYTSICYHDLHRNKRTTTTHVCDEATIQSTRNRSLRGDVTSCFSHSLLRLAAQRKQTPGAFHNRGSRTPPSQGQNTGNPQDQTKPLSEIRQPPTAMEVYDLMEEIL